MQHSNSPTSGGKTTPHPKRLWRTFFLPITLLLLLLSGFEAKASHYRYGNISWSRPNNTSRTVTFKVNQSWRRSAFGAPVVGSVIGGGTLLFGDATTSPISITVTSVNVVDDWFYGTATIVHTYAGTGTTFTASYSSGARIGSPLQNNGNGSFASQTIVQFVNGNLASPVSTVPPIINLPVGAAAASYAIPASDPDGSTLTYSLSTTAQFGGTHPAGVAVNPTTGVLTFNTVGKTVGHLYSTAVTITDQNGSNTVVDFLMLMVNTSNPPVYNYAITPANAFVYNLSPGQPLTFNVRAQDFDANSTVTLSVVGLTTGMTFSPALPTTANPVNTTFSWTPTAAQLGTYVLSFTAQDNVGIQAQTSVIINVSVNPTFIAPTPAANSSRFVLSGTLVTDVIRATNPNSAVLTRINTATLPLGATVSPAVPTAYAVNPTTTMSWTPSPANWGSNTFTYTALDQNAATATRTYEIEVNTMPAFASTPITTAQACVPYTYTITTTDANIPYGDVVDIHGSTLPAWLTLTSTGNGTAVLSGTPTAVDLGSHLVELEAEDIYHHVNPTHVEQSFNINVVDNQAPVANCQNVALIIGTNGIAALSAAQVNNGSSDNCGIASMTVSPNSFTCADITAVTTTPCLGTALNFNNTTSRVQINGINIAGSSFTLEAWAQRSGNTSSTGLDFIFGQGPPVLNQGLHVGYFFNDAFAANFYSNDLLTANNISDNQWHHWAVSYDATTNTRKIYRDGILIAQDIAPADFMGSGTFTIGEALGNYFAGNIDEVRIWNVVRSATDIQSSMSTCMTLPQNGLLAYYKFNEGSGNVLTNEVAGGPNGVITAPNWVASGANLPANTTIAATIPVTLTVTDAAGNSSTCIAQITVSDPNHNCCQAPVATCQPVMVSLNANGNATVTAAQVNNGSTADCGLQSMTLSQTNFSCAHVGNNTVTLTVTDINNLTSTCNAVVTVVDAIAPTIACAANVAVNADNASCAATNVNLGTPITADNCGVASVSNNAPTSYPVGTTTVTWTVTDVNGNTATCTQDVLVTDNQNPTITCAANVSVNADNASCAATNVNLGTPTTADNCGVASVSNNAPTSYPVGTTTVTWTVTDVNGNTATCTQDVIVTDNQNPTIACAANVSVNADNASCAATNVNLGTPTTADNCGVASVSNNAPTSYPVGTTTVTWTVTDVNGNTATCTQDVVVTDNQNPTITCAANVSVNADNASCAATNVNLGTPTTADNCGVASVSNNAPTSYPVGTTTVTWTVTDVNGNTATCTQDVLVTDNQNPTITCAANVSVNADNASCAATNVNLGTPTTADNCGVASVSNNAPTSYPVGTTTVTWTVTDVNGNTATCTQDVIVTDNQNPTITCAANVSVNADNASCAATNVNLGTPTTADNCGVASVSNNAPTSYPVGTTTVTWTVTDVNGNTATCTQNVVVTDNQNPTIACAANVSVNADNASCAATNVNLGTPTTADNCGVASVSNNAPTSYPVGTTTVTWTVTDVNGNTATCTQDVVVTDNQNPTITCAANVAVNADNASCAATNVNLGTPTTADNCGVASVTSNAPTSYPVGTTTVTWTVTDVNGNTATCTQDVIVTDNQNPTIACAANVAVNADNASCAATNVNLGTPTTADNCGVASVSNNAPTSYPVGTTTVTWTVTDVNGNTATCTQDVIVTDNQNPTIACAANVAVNADNASCAATNVNLGTPTTADNCGVASVSNNAPTSYPVGTTTVTWTVTDVNGNTATCTQNVVVTDNQNPTIACAANVAVNADNASCAATNVNLGTPTTADNCGVASVSNNAPTSYPVGTTTVTWTVTDVNGNTATCTQNVVVTDNQNPTIACAANVAVNADNASCAATNVNLGTPTTADNCGVASVSNNAPTSYPVGTTTVTWTVTDVNGNTATCTQDVLVTDNQNPTITCAANVSVNADNASCAATNVNLGTPTTADNCGVASVSNNAPTSYPVGTTTVTWTVTDVNGNTATCTQDVVVTDNQNPTITCAANVSVNADNASCAATNVNLGTPTTADNCGVASVSNNAPTSYPVGTTTVTWTVTDVNGNTATCTQNVVVTDNQAPVVVCPANIIIASCVSTASWTITSSDNCGIASVVSVPASGSTFNYGTTLVNVTATDVNGNVSTCAFTVTRANNLVANIAPLAVSPISTCGYGPNNANIVIGYGNGPTTATLNGSATGGTPAYTYSWFPSTNLSNASIANPVFTPNTTSGCSNYSYTLTVTDANGCSATRVVEVKVVNVVAAYNNNGSVKKVKVCHVTSSATNTEVDIEISPNAVATHLAHGDCLGGCSDDCDPNARFAHVEHDDHFQGGQVDVMPNPNNGSFALDITPAIPNTEVTVMIFDLSGKLIFSKVYADATYIHEDINLTELTGGVSAGMYMIKVINDEYVFSKKVVVTQ
jgi:hypothetical protein